MTWTDKDSIETNLVNSAESNTRGIQEEKAERNQLICNSSVRLKYSKTNRWTGDREAPSKPRLRMRERITGPKAMGKSGLQAALRTARGCSWQAWMK